MYKYKDLRGKIVASGERYSPRIHKHRLPFMVLRRVAVKNVAGTGFSAPKISALSGAMYTIRGLRDVLTARTNEKHKLAELWEDGFNAMLNVLRMYKVPIVIGSDTAGTLYKTFKSIGYDVVKDSFYAGNNPKRLSIHSMGAAITAFSNPSKKTVRVANRRIMRFNSRFGMNFDVSNFTKDNYYPILDEYMRMVNCAENVGSYHTLRYFVAFAPRFNISDGLLAEMNNALAGDVFSDELLIALYYELKKSFEEGKLPAQCGVFELFNRLGCVGNGAFYTNIFG